MTTRKPHTAGCRAQLGEGAQDEAKGSVPSLPSAFADWLAPLERHSV